MNKSQSVTLDPIPKSIVSGSKHDQRLEEILAGGPAAEIQQKKNFKQQAVVFCGSRIGLALITGVVLFILLLFIQPTYIFKRNKENKHSLKHINYGLTLIISLFGSVCVFLIPYFISKGSSLN
jgi:hypothetical protein